MMRHRQARAQRRALRKVICENEATSGMIAWIRHFNRFQLAFTICSLVFSVVLLFIGTYVYFDDVASFPFGEPHHPMYINDILHLYGINETDFSMLFSSKSNDLTRNRQIGIAMMFVASISIMIEVGLICAILFEHFKWSVLYTVIMAGGLATGLWRSSLLNIVSLTFQVILLGSFVFFEIGIKVKIYAANKILLKGEQVQEMRQAKMVAFDTNEKA